MTAPTRPRIDPEKIKPLDIAAMHMLTVGGHSTHYTARKLGITWKALNQRMVRLRRDIGATSTLHAAGILIEMGLLDLSACRPLTCGVSWQFRPGMSVGPCLHRVGHDGLHRDATDAEWPNTWPAAGVRS